MKPMIYDTFNWLVRDLPIVQLSSVNPGVQIHNPSVCRHVSFLSIFCLYILFKMTDKCFFIHLTLITVCPYKTIMTPTWTSPTHVVGWLIVHTLIASKVATIHSKICKEWYEWFGPSAYNNCRFSATLCYDARTILKLS